MAHLNHSPQIVKVCSIDLLEHVLAQGVLLFYSNQEPHLISHLKVLAVHVSSFEVIQEFEEERNAKVDEIVHQQHNQVRSFKVCKLVCAAVVLRNTEDTLAIGVQASYKGLFHKCNVEDHVEGVEELKGESFNDQGSFILGIGPVILKIGQSIREFLVDDVEDLNHY